MLYTTEYLAALALEAQQHGEHCVAACFALLAHAIGRGPAGQLRLLAALRPLTVAWFEEETGETAPPAPGAVAVTEPQKDEPTQAEWRAFAGQVVAVIDVQKQYFDERRKGLPVAAATLDRAKAAERALRARALELRGVNPGGLF